MSDLNENNKLFKACRFRCWKLKLSIFSCTGGVLISFHFVVFRSAEKRKKQQENTLVLGATLRKCTGRTRQILSLFPVSFSKWVQRQHHVSGFFPPLISRDCSWQMLSGDAVWVLLQSGKHVIVLLSNTAVCVYPGSGCLPVWYVCVCFTEGMAHLIISHLCSSIFQKEY